MYHKLWCSHLRGGDTTTGNCYGGEGPLGIQSRSGGRRVRTEVGRRSMLPVSMWTKQWWSESQDRGRATVPMLPVPLWTKHPTWADSSTFPVVYEPDEFPRINLLTLYSLPPIERSTRRKVVAVTVPTQPRLMVNVKVDSLPLR